MKQKLLLKTMLLLCILVGGASNAWATDVTYTLTISSSDFNTTSYAANNNEKTSNAVCTTDNTKTYQVKWTSNQVMKNSSNMQWQKNNGYIYNSTDLGTINSVTVNSSAGSFTTYYGTAEQPSSGSAGSGKGYFKTKVGNATGTTSSIVISFTVSEGGGSSTPTLSADPATATAFTYTVGNGPSEDQMFTITGKNLVSADITATVSSDYEITDNTDYSSSVTIASGDIVSVRLKAGLAKGTHNGTLTLSSTDATNVVINLSGTVTGQTYAIEQYTAPATAHGTITFSPASPIEDGTEVTLSAEPAEGYTFTANSWVIYKQSGEDYVVDNSVTVTANKFTMPAYAIWVDGTFAAKPTYAITCVASPVAGGTIVPDGNAYEGKTVTISCEAASGYELTGIVITKTSDGSATGITPAKSGDDYTFTMPAYAVTATATFAPCFTWDLSTASYEDVSDPDEVTWTNTYATMNLTTGSSSTAANNYLGDGTKTHTRFYKDNVLTFAPATGFEITKVEITAVTSYVAGFTGNSWTNATASENGTKVTVTPTDGNKSFYVSISAACRATAVKVYYKASTIPYITAAHVNIECNATNGTIVYTVNNPKDGGVLTAALTTGDWLELGAVSTNVPFTTTANNTKLDRTATVTLTYTYDTSKTATKLVTITQAGDPNAKDTPTIPVTDAEIAYGSTFTVDVSGIIGGTVTVTSGNTSVATVSELVITPVAVGSVEITVSTEEDATYAAGSETFLLTITAPTGKKSPALFYESFDASTGGPLSTWGGSEANGTVNTDNAGWTLTSGSGAGSSAKFGTGSANGSATTPSITVENGETYTLSFNAAPWSEETSKTITVTVTGGTINGNASATTSSMTAQKWNEFDFDIVATSTSLTINFDCSANRFFLDEVMIEKSGVAPTATVTVPTSGFGTYCSEYPLDFSKSYTGLKAWYVSNVAKDGSDVKVTFSQVTKAIKGGQGILLAGTPGTHTVDMANSSEVLSDNKLVGVMTPTYIETISGDNTIFGLKNGEFVKAAAGVIGANKAYLPIATSLFTAGARVIMAFDDDETTGISAMHNSQCIMHNEVFDLQGRKIAQPKKGLYIKNGKKVVIK